MDLSKILSISGRPGLYRLVGEAKNNIVVESLIDGKRAPAFSHERISSLHEISIYTTDEDMPLVDVFKKIFELQEGKPLADPKKMSSNELKALMAEAVPDYDSDAVYVSDIKKIFSWYNFLLDKDLLEFTDEEESEEPKEDEKESPKEDEQEKK